MTSSIAQKLSNGTDTESETAKRDYGLAVLRTKETKVLIGVACDAISETSQVTHQMHKFIYDRDTDVPDAQLQEQLEEALSCWQTADHYMRMLSSVLEERSGDSPVPWRPTDSPF
jgi:hypothetical protein